jgi:probable biosynthetic protein (TIGR04098 family)
MALDRPLVTRTVLVVLPIVRLHTAPFVVAMSTIATLLEKEIPGFTVDQAGLAFWQLGVDSFGMIELRVTIEHALGAAIPDAFWTRLETPAQLLDYAGERPRKALEVTAKPSLRRHYSLNMPQMALGGLSESWLFKELGDAHWAMITSGLGAPSSALLDGNGDRLYATFTRLRIQATAPLASFEENAELALEGRICRFGAGMFFSEIALAGAGKGLSASIMSSFTKRGSLTSNSGLLKGQPAIPAGCPIPDVATRPEFGQGYRERRGVALPAALFETPYEIIPYHDINGVGLLYFAAYPIISDICELKYMGRANDWALQASTVARDVFYFANCDAHDRLIYRVHARHDAPSVVDIESSLSRASDGALMAYLVTRKVQAGG